MTDQSIQVKRPADLNIKEIAGQSNWSFDQNNFHYKENAKRNFGDLQPF